MPSGRFAGVDGARPVDRDALGTLAKGRYHSAETIRTYGGLLSDQSQLLERLIDNLLAYASLSHVTQRYTFQPLSIADLVESALEL